MDDDSSLKKMTRNRRNISWYKQHSDFWSWYKYFTDTGNQKGVQDLDRIYLSYLQNKNRAEGRRSYDLYLRHLGEIYKSCAESDNPDCVTSYMSRPKGREEASRPAPVKACDPYRDPYCLRSRGRLAAMAPAGVKGPAPIRAPAAQASAPAPAKSTGLGSYYYYAPVAQPFLSAQQQAELLRICDAKDVECLQYHLRAAYGYRAASAPAPSYAHLGCDPGRDANCEPRAALKSPSDSYHSYPTCDPNYDPYCIPSSAPAEQPCNPVFDDNCNPLTASKLSSRRKAEHETALQKQPGSPPHAVPHVPLGAEEESRHHLGPRGKTKEGYDCYMFYDKECLPLGAQDNSQASGASLLRRAPARTSYEDTGSNCHPYDPACGRKAPQHSAAGEAYEPHLNPDGTRNGVVEPDPDCDPEYDRNCRLRRADEPKVPTGAVARDTRREEEGGPRERQDEQTRHKEPFRETPGYDEQRYEPYQSGQEEPYAAYPPQEHMATRLEEFMGEYGEQVPKYDDSQDRRFYSGEYRKK
ncbi:actinodin1 precursor-like [Scleropages formosus]|uniref:Actinodin1-like n=1 Tax=Scleropages formosus TaxID=113540 RepID=A0A0P7UNZ6_SCLFO|nr:actinodin1 precursor-like [Scleropages formosus]